MQFQISLFNLVQKVRVSEISFSMFDVPFGERTILSSTFYFGLYKRKEFLDR